MPKGSKQKIIAIVGTTASGKTSLAVSLSLKFGGEVVSADSRQVYKYMDIGSGKDLVEYEIESNNGGKIKVPYHLIDVAQPNEVYDLAKWLNDAKLAIDNIRSRKKLPILAGGTGLYAQALLDGYKLSETSVNKELREMLENLKSEELFSMLQSLDSNFANSLNRSELNNKRRLIRQIEIIKGSKKITSGKKEVIRPYDDLIIGLTWPREILRERIYKRIIDRIENQGMIEEVKMLHEKKSVSWKRLESFGLEYKFLSHYLQNKINYEEAIEKLYYGTCQFSKRQMTWLRRWEKQGARIHWVKEKEEAFDLVDNFVKNKYD